MKDFYKTKGISRTLLGLSCILLSSCAMNENDYESNLASPSSFGSLVNQDASLVEINAKDSSVPLNFFESFQDEKLNSFIKKALVNNYDMQQAYLNLKQARIDLGLSQSDLHPTLNASLGSSVRKELDPANSSVKSANANLGISYEVDLFNRLGAAERSNYEFFKASAYDYKAMRLSIIKQTSACYWQYAYAKEALKKAEDQLKVSQKRLDLIKTQMQYGAADALAYDHALVNHRNIEQSVYQKGYELNNAHNALSTLLGLHTEVNLYQEIDDTALDHLLKEKVAVDLPASLLQKRPDLMAYEARLRASLANVDATKASFYPTFNLNAGVSTGTAGDIVKFFTNPIASLGGTIALPFLNYNELSLREESSLIAKDKAQLNFANGFITAVEEVSKALNELSYQEHLNKSSLDEYNLTKKNYDRYLEKYRVGSADLSDVLDASDSLRSAEMKLLGSKRDLLNASMSLMIALGGDTFTEDKSKDAQQILEDATNIHSQALALSTK